MRQLQQFFRHHHISVCVLAILTLCIVSHPASVSAAPEAGFMRLSVHGAFQGAMFINSDQLNTLDDIGRIVSEQHATLQTISSVHLFGFGLFTQLEYAINQRFAVGAHIGITLPYPGSLEPIHVRVPIRATAQFVITEWLSLQPEIGAHIIRNPQTGITSPNFDATLRVTLFDLLDISSGFVYGNIAGFYIEAGIHLFNLFDTPVSSHNR